MLKIAVVTVQSEYLQKIMGQLGRIFGDRLDLHPIQLSNLSQARIEPGETVFSAIPNLIKRVKALFPYVKNYIIAKRSINVFNTGDLIQLRPGRRILVVSDIRPAAVSITRDLENQQLGHTYIPFTPEAEIPRDYEYVVTPADLPLLYDLKILPPDFTNIINIGLRVISLETVFELNSLLEQPLDPITLSNNFMSSLVFVAHKWPVSKRNKYINTWMGHKSDHKAKFRFSDFTATSQPMQDLLFQARKMARRKDPIHISGETGVGKHRLAQAIHNASATAELPFVSIKCSGRDPLTLQNELFGWEEGGNIYPGLVETASGGTFCIEEIDQLTPELQSQLVQVLAEDKVLRTNGRIFVPVSVRLITTSIQKIQALFANNQLHKELYYRLSLFTCHMPALEERLADFEELVKNCLVNDFNRPDLELTPETLRILKNQHWEGNLQELRNVLAHLACLAERQITAELLPYYLDRSTERSAGIARSPGDGLAGDRLVAEIEDSGFLEEARAILEIYGEGKQANQSFGRKIVCERLKTRDIELSPQQLRLRQKRLNDLGLVLVRKGRAGTTISTRGEQFLAFLQQR